MDPRTPDDSSRAPLAGRYRLDREVGRGGMGAVWLARDERLGREVAVKRVGHLPGESLPRLARAMREARSTAALNHRNVVAVYDALEEGDHLWLVMEYVPGRTLAQITADEGPLDPLRAARIGAQVADGLAAAHAAGMVHRDVKPGNILVTDDDVAKISDFGIARSLADDQLTQTGLMVGTPAYFAPELARGADASPASDVWALGATLFAAVEGHGPYPSQGNALAVLAGIATEPPPLPERAGPLREPIRRMMDPDVAARWSMADCAHALRQVNERHPGAPVPAPTPEQTALFTAPTPEPTPEPEPAPTTPVGDDARRRRTPLVLAALLVLLLMGGAAWAVTNGDDDEPAATADRPRSSTPADQPTADPTPSETTDPDPAPEEPETTPAEPETTEPETPAPDAGSPGDFVAGYHGLLPGDTATAWMRFTEGYQSDLGGFEQYDGFWRTIDAVSVEGVEEVDDTTVDVTLAYTTDGSTQTETRRVYLEAAGDGFLIADDEIV